MPTLGCVVAYHAAHPAVAHQLRVTVDSFSRHINRTVCPHLVIVDDCSPRWPATDDYLSHLERNGVATLLRLGDPRTSYYHPKGRGPRSETEHTSFGHGVAIMRGIEMLQGLGCTHVWMLDSDCVVMDGSAWLRDALALFRYENVATVSDYMGGAPSAYVQICDEDAERSYAGNEEVSRIARGRKWCHNAILSAGFPHFSCALADVDAITRYGGLENAGTVNANWFYRAMRGGARSAYFPFYQSRHVYHLGSGSTLFSRDRWQKGEYRGFGNARDGDARFGRRNEGCYHAGYLQLAIPSTEYLGWLETSVASAPHDRLMLPPREWFVDPDRAPFQPKRYVRFFEECDKASVEALVTHHRDPIGPLTPGRDVLVALDGETVIGAARITREDATRWRLRFAVVSEPWDRARWFMEWLIEYGIACHVTYVALESGHHENRELLKAHCVQRSAEWREADGVGRMTVYTGRG